MPDMLESTLSSSAFLIGLALSGLAAGGLADLIARRIRREEEKKIEIRGGKDQVTITLKDYDPEELSKIMSVLEKWRDEGHPDRE